MLFRIQHETTLTYSEPVTETVFEVRMAPPSDNDQTSLDYRLRIEPPAPVTTYRDGYGNRADLVNLLTPHASLTVRAATIARTHRRPGEARLAEVRFRDLEHLPIEALEALRPSPLVGRSPELDALIASLPRRSGTLKGIVECAVEAVHGRLKYEKKVTTAWTPVGEALTLGRGVCQDFAHAFIGACRGIGLPARYVSGYVHGPGELATHAWVQVWAGANGWIDIDPTRGGFVADEHVVTAVGRDYSDVPPNRGVWRGRADESIAVSVLVEPIDDLPNDWQAWSNPVSSAPAIRSRSRTNGRKPPLGRGALQQQQSQQQ